MKLEGNKTAGHPLLFDVRVRERLLAKGILDPKALERYLAELPDSQGQSETVSADQPALGGDAEAD